mgnify:CR=1 FL=1
MATNANIDQRALEDQWNRAPEEVSFAGRVFLIPPMPMRRRNLWLARLMRTMGKHGMNLAAYSRAVQEARAAGLDDPQISDDPAAMLELNAALADMVFEYAGWTPDEVKWIDLRASDEEIQGAFAVCAGLANPTRPLATEASGATTTATDQASPGLS